MTELVAIYEGREWDRASAAVFALADKIQHGVDVNIPTLVKQELKRYLNRVATVIVIRNSTPYPGGTRPSSLSVRSGTANRSILDSVDVNRGRSIETIRGFIGGVGYLRIHETGGEIRPRNGRYLTVPLPAALYPNGVPRKRSARDWNDTFVRRSRNGNLLIFQKRGRTITPLYVLKTRVYIPPRLGMSLTLDQFIGEFLTNLSQRVKREFLL